MRIAFISQPWNRVVPPVQDGSVTIWTYEVARRLASDTDVTIYARWDPPQPHESRDEYGIEYRRFSTYADRRVLSLARRFTKSEQPLFANTLYYLGYVLRVAEDIRRRHCDIVHIHNFSQFAPLVHAINPHAKIVLHMHCEWLTQIKARSIDRRLGKVDRVLGCSDYIAGTVRDKFPHHAGRCFGLHNGANTEFFVPRDRNGPRGEPKRILFVGRVSPEKGVHVLVEAFREVLAKHPDTRLEIVGPFGSAPREFVVDMSDDAKTRDLDRFFDIDYVDHLMTSVPPEIAANIDFVGSIPNHELLDHYRRAEALVLPSVWKEPFGIPIVEAMACGVPVIGTTGGGIGEIIEHEKTGYLVNRGEVGDLAGRIVDLLDDEKRQSEMGRAARRRAEAFFSWDTIARDLLDHYRAIG